MKTKEILDLKKSLDLRELRISSKLTPDTSIFITSSRISYFLRNYLEFFTLFLIWVILVAIGSSLLDLFGHWNLILSIYYVIALCQT
jgi:hypothetical protein